MKKVAIVGAGQRAYRAYAQAFYEEFPGKVKVVGVCDPNETRRRFFRDSLDPDIWLYEDFDLMLRETEPDYVLVTTVDRYHHEYIVRALESGFDVIVEKPMTNTEENARLIRETEKRTGRKVIVTFNCRFMPTLVKLKELIVSGAVGKPLAMNYEYYLNKVHGGDYFKRWHRKMENCGGMLVHKSTHHFDIANWLVGDEPESVTAFGNRVYYGKDDRAHGERCTTCKTPCESYENLAANSLYKSLYLGAEHEDGYVRDHCVFKPDTDIYDNMSVSVKYKGGAILTYSLNMFSSYEGYRITVTGDRGRLELKEDYTAKAAREYGYQIRLVKPCGEIHDIEFPRETGSHSGADIKLLAMLFDEQREDPLGQCSDSFDGVKSALIGICANKSIREGRIVQITPYLDRMR